MYKLPQLSQNSFNYGIKLANFLNKIEQYSILKVKKASYLL